MGDDAVRINFVGTSELARACYLGSQDVFDSVFWLPGGVDAIPCPRWAKERERVCPEMFDADTVVMIGVQVKIAAANLRGCCVIGFHPTLLPSGRGGSPIQRQILDHEVPGCTFFRMTDKLDAGPVLGQVVLPWCQTSAEYYAACCAAAPALLRLVLAGNQIGRKQDDPPTYRKRLTDGEQRRMSERTRDVVYSGHYRKLRLEK